MTRWSEFDFLLGSTRQDALQWERGFSPESTMVTPRAKLIACRDDITRWADHSAIPNLF